MSQVIKERSDIRLKLVNLYSLFPGLSHSVIHWNVYKSRSVCLSVYLFTCLSIIITVCL